MRQQAVTDTSVNAFHRHRESGQSSVQRQRILNFMRTKSCDWSIGEIASWLGMEKSTVSGRINELLHSGELIERPKRKDRVSGVTIRPVGIRPVQMEIFQ